MHAHSYAAFDMTTLEGQRAAARARAARLYGHRLNLVSLPQRVIPIVAPQVNAEPEVPAAQVQREPVRLVPPLSMHVPGTPEPSRAIRILTPGEIEALRQYNERTGVCERVIREVCQAYEVSRDDLWSASRSGFFTAARKETYFRMKHESKRSLPDIGRRCGGRDHTTVLHGVRSAAKLLAEGWRMRTLPHVIGYSLAAGEYLYDAVYTAMLEAKAQAEAEAAALAAAEPMLWDVAGVEAPEVAAIVVA